MTTNDAEIQRRAAIRAEKYHGSLTPLRAYENALADLFELFPYIDREQARNDADRLLAHFDGDYSLVVDELAFKIEVKLQKGQTNDS